MSNVDKFLEHYGVKGMKWGVRKKRYATTKVQIRSAPGRRVETSGGTGQKAHSDAVRAAVSKQKAKKSTVDALSDQELKNLVNRMNLEQQYHRLAPKSAVDRGKMALAQIILNSGKQQVQQISNEMVAQYAKALRD